VHSTEPAGKKEGSIERGRTSAACPHRGAALVEGEVGVLEELGACRVLPELLPRGVVRQLIPRQLSPAGGIAPANPPAPPSTQDGPVASGHCCTATWTAHLILCRLFPREGPSPTDGGIGNDFEPWPHRNTETLPPLLAPVLCPAMNNSEHCGLPGLARAHQRKQGPQCNAGTLQV
jgi:hypothetical protein